LLSDLLFILPMIAISIVVMFFSAWLLASCLKNVRWFALWLFCIFGNVLDVVSTDVMLKGGSGQEGNPIARFLFEEIGFFWTFLLHKGSLFVILLLGGVVFNNHPKWGYIIRCCLLGVGIIAVIASLGNYFNWWQPWIENFLYDK